MKHDLEHEQVQDAAVKKLASVVASLCASSTFTPGVKECHEVMQMLSADEETPEEPLPAPKEPEAAETAPALVDAEDVKPE